MDTYTTIKVKIINAFVDNGEGGNPAGVVLDADMLSDKDKLEISKKVGLSETAFVSESETADFKLDFFTPTRQIAHCGHATIATFSYLKQIGALKTDNTSKETIEGNRKIKIVEDLAFMEQLAPSYVDVNHKEGIILRSLGLKKTDLIPENAIRLVNTGNSFIIVPVASAAILKNIVPDFELIETISEEFDLIGFYIFTTDTESTTNDATSRMFAPRYGILEEAATGMAAGPLACYLYDVFGSTKTQFAIQQGKFMPKPSPSLIQVDLKIEDGKIAGVMAGGKGILKTEIEIQIQL